MSKCSIQLVGVLTFHFGIEHSVVVGNGGIWTRRNLFGFNWTERSAEVTPRPCSKYEGTSRRMLVSKKIATNISTENVLNGQPSNTATLQVKVRRLAEKTALRAAGSL